MTCRDIEHQPYAVLGHADFPLSVGVIFLDDQASIGVMGGVKDCDNSWWDPQNSHNWKKKEAQKDNSRQWYLLLYIATGTTSKGE